MHDTGFEYIDSDQCWLSVRLKECVHMQDIRSTKPQACQDDVSAAVFGMVSRMQPLRDLVALRMQHMSSQHMKQPLKQMSTKLELLSFPKLTNRTFKRAAYWTSGWHCWSWENTTHLEKKKYIHVNRTYIHVNSMLACTSYRVTNTNVWHSSHLACCRASPWPVVLSSYLVLSQLHLSHQWSPPPEPWQHCMYWRYAMQVFIISDRSSYIHGILCNRSPCMGWICDRSLYGIEAIGLHAWGNNDACRGGTWTTHYIHSAWQDRTLIGCMGGCGNSISMGSMQHSIWLWYVYELMNGRSRPAKAVWKHRGMIHHKVDK